MAVPWILNPSLLPVPHDSSSGLLHPLVEMPATCINGTDQSWTCAVIYDWTGNEALAHAARWLIGKPLTILTLVLIGLVVRWLLHRVIARVVRQIGEQGVVPDRFERGRLVDLGQPEAIARRAQRAATMGSLLRSIVSGVVLVVVAIMAISELGYDVAPLVASAGILGVALGFGAQSLVRDFLSGIFMIFEDQYGVGDVIDLDGIGGTVEAVSLRVTRLRDIHGTVWYVRNGEILRVGNQSQNWARSVLDVGVGYGEDVSRVRRILTEITHDMAAEPEWGDQILEEPEILGVQSLDVDSVVIRVSLKTVPLSQWKVSRELRERIKLRFDAEGIEIPFPQRVVWHREDRSEAAPPAE